MQRWFVFSLKRCVAEPRRCSQRLALLALQSGQPTTFDMVLDHDFGWDDSLICGGRVQGVVLPDAQNAGEKFWAELAARTATRTWGVKENFSILSGGDDSAAPQAAHPGGGG